jgi:dTDP-glucose 4,6-dehydratase
VRAVVTGGAGFVGSNLCRALLARGTEVVAVDNLITGDRANVADLVPRAGFSMVEHDVTQPIPVEGPLDAVLHFASPASPPAYLALPLETLAVGSDGTRNALDLARDRGARFVLASTSEVYGDPLEHPQRETYYGNVNPIGPRSVYDEAKRFAEAITIAYHRSLGVDVRLVRIFNTYGPGLAPRDGRVVSNFMVQAMRGESLTVHGDGTQTRSFCFVDDLVRGVLALLDVEAPASRVVNIGNPDELTVLELAKLTLEIVGSTSDVVFQPPYPDDPTQRRPDITLATQMLGWTPVVELRDGLGRLHEWYRSSGVADA